MDHHKATGACGLLLFAIGCAPSDESRMVGHWKLAQDVRDASGHGHHGTNHGADLSGPDFAAFDGIDDYVEVADRAFLDLGTSPFSIAVWVHTKAELDDVLGDIISKYDPARRKGFNFSIMNYAAVTSAQSNYRNVHFGIDDGKVAPEWIDCGKPGCNRCVFALTVHNGDLYAGTFEGGEDATGHVYRYMGGTTWEDCGNPDASNAVVALAVFGGQLYAGIACYNAGGSKLPASGNQMPGGKVYRYDGGRKWSFCGQLQNDETGTATTVHTLAAYRGKLYASTMYRPGKGLYEYQAGQKWRYMGNPGYRVDAISPFNGDLYATSYDRLEGTKINPVFRFDKKGRWTELPMPAGTTQTYAFMVYRGKLLVTEWPRATVFQLDDDTWISLGRLGQEKETMGISVYNGKLYAGTLPLGEVYRYDGGTTWTNMGRLDLTADVTYRRVWSMAVYQGKLFAGTLPSGHVYSFEAGKNVTCDHELEPGWRHLVAVRETDRLKLYIDGMLVASSSTFKPADYDISNNKPLMIGFGAHDYFNGQLRDLRLYRRALTEPDVAALYKSPR